MCCQECDAHLIFAGFVGGWLFYGCVFDGPGWCFVGGIWGACAAALRVRELHNKTEH
jgi:hypothetical protein